LPWLGDAAFFIRGTEPGALEGALVLESKDDEAAAQTVEALRGTAAAQGLGSVQPLGLSGEGTGFTIIRRSSSESSVTSGTSSTSEPTEAPEPSQPIDVVQQDGKVVIGLGDAATVAAPAPIKRRDKAPSFAAASGALGDDGPAFFVSADQAVQYLAASIGLDNPNFKMLKPYLARLSYLTAGGGDSLKLIVGAD